MENLVELVESYFCEDNFYWITEKLYRLLSFLKLAQKIPGVDIRGSFFYVETNYCYDSVYYTERYLEDILKVIFLGSPRPTSDINTTYLTADNLEDINYFLTENFTEKETQNRAKQAIEDFFVFNSEYLFLIFLKNSAHEAFKKIKDIIDPEKTMPFLVAEDFTLFFIDAESLCVYDERFYSQIEELAEKVGQVKKE